MKRVLVPLAVAVTFTGCGGTDQQELDQQACESLEVTIVDNASAAFEFQEKAEVALSKNYFDLAEDNLAKSENAFERWQDALNEFDALGCEASD